MPTPSDYQRSSGVLLPVTSLPGPFGIGDLGPMAFRWIETLAAAKQVWWQMLPVGPTGLGDCPYQSPSTFAGNQNLVSPELLRADNLVAEHDLTLIELPSGPVEYEVVIPNKCNIISKAFKRFQAGDTPELRPSFSCFCEDEARWLNDFALFAAIKDRFGGLPWWQWPKSLAFRDPKAISVIEGELHDLIQRQKFAQFLFFRQWAQLRSFAEKKGVRLLGDLPIYVAEDSADVWCRPFLFMLDTNLRPTCVSGVPPDYFSKTGQLWGSPLYNWGVHHQSGFAWWIDRMKAALRLFDQIRIDHFRGIEAFWSVPAGHGTAEGGRWVPGPRDQLLGTLSKAIGHLPVVAEDLGFITQGVDDLRKRFGLPGIRVLQFAFGGEVEKRFLPHRFNHDLVVVTGTHDNDTTVGWFESLTKEERHSFEAYAPSSKDDPVWSLIRLAWASVARQSITPLQDLLSLGSVARMNTPGTSTGNWRWRATNTDLVDHPWIERITDYTQVYERTAR
jgi:4-alpha-glucanotransferase